MRLAHTTTGGLVLAASLMLASPAVATHNAPDLDCEDFDFQEQAQALFESYPEDRYRLDDDDDGMACDALLPSDPEGREWVVLEHTDEVVDLAELVAANDECSDFATQEEAQFVLDEVMFSGGDPRGLDEDGDGIACEDAFATTQATEEEEEPITMPEGGVATGAGGTAGDDAPTGLIVAGGLALTAAGGLVLYRRRSLDS